MQSFASSAQQRTLSHYNTRFIWCMFTALAGHDGHADPGAGDVGVRFQQWCCLSLHCLTRMHPCAVWLGVNRARWLMSNSFAHMCCVVIALLASYQIWVQLRIFLPQLLGQVFRYLPREVATYIALTFLLDDCKAIWILLGQQLKDSDLFSLFAVLVPWVTFGIVYRHSMQQHCFWIWCTLSFTFLSGHIL